MTDSDRLSARLDGVVGRRTTAKHGDPQPLRAAVGDAVEALARRHMTNPDRFRYATDEEIAAHDAADRLERRREKVERLMARIPAKYRQATLARTEQGLQAWQWFESFRAGDRKSLIIMGPKGTGKTWMACALARHLMDPDAPTPCTYTTVADMLEALRGPFRPGLDIDMALYTGAPVLLLDDFGAENLTDWGREQLYRLSHARDHHGLPTIVTTNLTGPEIWERYESRTVERLFNGAARIDLDGESRRVLPI